MKVIFTAIFLVLAGAGFLISDLRAQATTATSATRPVTAPDAIEMTKLGDLDLYWGIPFLDRLAHFSPDGKKVVVVARRGNLKSNTKDYFLLLWRTDQLLHSAPPKKILTMSSSSNRQGIKDLRWLSDNETLEFLGEQPGTLQQVYTYSIRHRQLKEITHEHTNVLSFSVTPDGQEVAYLAERPTRTMWTEKASREGIVVSTQELNRLIQGYTPDGDCKLFLLRNGVVREFSAPIDLQQSNIFLSPDGKFILVASNVQEVPDLWKEYSDPEIQRLVSQNLHQGQYSGLYRCEWIDTTSGESKLLLDSPLGAGELEATWSPDARSVVVNNTYLPLLGMQGQERRARQSSTFAVEIAVPTGTISEVTHGGLILVNWDTESNVLRFADWNLAHENRAGSEVFFSKIKTWEKVEAPRSFRLRPRIVVDEDLNTPARMFAIDLEKDQRVFLFDPNPQFKQLRFGRVEEVRWKGTDGHDVKGGLYYPVDFSPGRRYPLVIQTHGWMSKAFWLDGPFTTAFAAQPLVGKNIMVLQTDEDYTHAGTPEEITREVSAFEGAIDYLDEKQLIQRDRVGIIGFSRTCLFVKYALTHSKFHFAAASVTDGVDEGYFQYIVTLNAFPAIPQDSEGANGGTPFGEGLKSWISRSPAFAVNNVRTPLRITALNPLSLLLEWEWFAALSRLGKPVEMVAIQDGDHILQKPWDRMISQQGNVDWFCFWLKGEEDSDPHKSLQYARWRGLRAGKP
ncbi:MAG TPA: prolyl oligopeptidase family serine peptidase [Candidatus Acidoferrum sp.]|nr:prolyl oligopeptidase family serine peptidase [Candidatus Acidoferrum sp.]